MIAAAGGSWPSRKSKPGSSGNDDGSETIGGALELLERVLELTRSAVERFEEGAVDEALHLLDLRDRLFTEAGEVLGRLSATYNERAADGHVHAVVQHAVIEDLTRAAAELGRLDSWIARRLFSLRDRIGDELTELPRDPEPNRSPPPGTTGRHIDLCG